MTGQGIPDWQHDLYTPGFGSKAEENNAQRIFYATTKHQRRMKLNNRELLELAAKAAGIEVVWLESSYYGPTMARVDVKSGEGEITEPWNPLTDDGDALRLAVKLGGELRINLDEWWSSFSSKIGTDKGWYVADEDPYAATRRAIVRAAAEIGRTHTPKGE